ncbi:MAG: chemotaxis protein CheB [bacterium]|nr:chemotaxis protein CheB [bacterium]
MNEGGFFLAPVSPLLPLSQIKQDAARENSSFPIVGIGASAGGLEAFGELLKALPKKTGMAFVLIQHLAPQHESLLGGLLSQSSQLPVIEAAQGMTVKIDHIYVIPPNAKLTIAKGILQLGQRDISGPHLPIDLFFRSLAEDQGALAMGVVLSGTGSDGTLGLEAVRSVGGITFVQSEVSAKYIGMPHSVIEGGAADFILTPEKIAEALIRMGKHPGMLITAEADHDFVDQENYNRILAVVHTHTGADFSSYRDTTIRRRITRRMILAAKDDFADYADFMDTTPGEIDALYNDILINVTSFFRDPDVFKNLKTEVFPEMTKGERSAPIRIWVPGCSTGQEPYSLAMALFEFMDEKSIHIPIQIFATDLDEDALQKAREGLYLDTIEAEISPERLKRFFTKENGKYRIAKSLRDICTFAKQNVVADPPFSRVDMVSCRNLLIYLALPLQRRVVPTFHYALKPGGFLLLGSAETVGIYSDMFDVVDQENRIYVKKLTPARQYPHFNSAQSKVAHPDHATSARTVPAPAQTDWLREADRVLIQHYVPAGVLINDTLDILQFRGRTSPYLEPSTGEPSHNLLRMATTPLISSIRSAVEKCRTTGQDSFRSNIRIRNSSEVSDITVRVLIVHRKDQPERCFLVLFEPEKSAALPQSAHPDMDENARLQLEVAAAHEHLQFVIEQKDAASEQLRSANEEILSSNEELQSTNEELETAKEELQSVNEELTTVNEQLQHRNVELNQLNDDMSNLLESTDLPILVIGGDLKIRRVTPKADKVFKLTSNEKPRMVRSLQDEITIPNLEEELLKVIKSGRVVEHEVQTRDNHWWLLRIHPYHGDKGKMDAAVIVLFDIDDIRKVRQELHNARDYALSVIETVRDPLVVLDGDLRLQTANEAFYKMFDIDRKHAEKNLIYQTAKGLFDKPELRHLLENVLPEKGSLRDYEITMTFKDSRPSTLLLNARRIIYNDNRTQIFLLAIEDITERKALKNSLQMRTKELVEAASKKDEFLAMLAHELRNPLAPISNSLQILTAGKADGALTAEAYKVMGRHIAQMGRLIDDLLDVSRIANGKVELHLEEMELKYALQSAIETSAPLIEAAHHVLTINLPSEPLWVRVDPARLMQLFGNLLNNAAKYTPHKGQISLSAFSEGNEAVIRIKDNGVGIPAHMLEKIFDMFAQIDTSLERSRGGLGIGLMLVKQLAILHGGSVCATSEGLNQGSEFTVRLPLISKPVAGKKPEPSVLQIPDQTPSLRILILDDNESAAKTMGWMMEMMGHKVEVAYDGPEAIALAKVFKPNAVLLDIGLPGMNGYEVCRALRLDPLLKNTIIIAQTGWGDEEHRKKSKEAGFDFHLVKPAGMEALKTVLLSVDPNLIKE